jgi:hypothetical protein
MAVAALAQDENVHVLIQVSIFTVLHHEFLAIGLGSQHKVEGEDFDTQSTLEKNSQCFL